MEGIAPIQEKLEPIFPYMSQEQVQQVALLMGPGIQPAAQGTAGQNWKFTDDVGWTLLISVEAATLSVGAEYGDFSEFSTRLRTVLEVLGEHAGVIRCDRLGLRYVDIAAVPPGEEQAWRTWFRPELTGWSATDVVGDNARLHASITQTQLSVPPTGELSGPSADIVGTIRHGYVPANTLLPGIGRMVPLETPAYLLDIDIYVGAQQPFDPAELVRQTTLFHDQLDRFFRWVLTPAGEQHFGLEELE